MNISIVIPNYNGKELLEKNLPKVIEAVYFYKEKNKNDVEIIVIDDASTDNSIEIINSFKVRLITNKTNLGFSKTVNIAVKEASGDIVVLLNTDVCPDKDFLSPLVFSFDDKNVFAVGCMDNSIENGKSVLRGRGIGEFKRGFLLHSRGEVDNYKTLWVSGGSGAFKKDIWNRLNGFNNLYSPFYYEDIDLSYRALKAGYKIIFNSKSLVVHEHSKGAIKSEYKENKIKEVAYRNQFLFVWLNITDLNLVFQHFLWLPYYLIKMTILLDFSFLKGFMCALSLIPKVIIYRSRNLKIFKLTDRQVFETLL